MPAGAGLFQLLRFINSKSILLLGAYMKYLLMVVFAYLTLCPAALASEFDRPWTDPKVALVLDPFSGNTIDWDKLGEEKRVIAVIHKATVGVDKTDPKYRQRKTEAQKRGYLWGSYHWGVAGNARAQADYYIQQVKPADDELIALDLEDITSRTLMNAEDALVFIRRVKELTNRYPVLYTNHASALILSKKFSKTELINVPLWYARFKPAVTDFPKGIWPTYTLWQFSSEIRIQKLIPGIHPDMDINVYNGSVDALRSAWPLAKKGAASDSK
jgi:lysozyme